MWPGALFGSFLGFAAGLFEDLSIFLQIEETIGAIGQLPKLIGSISENPGVIVSMIDGHHMVQHREPVPHWAGALT